jgi:hypothetical protein
VGSQAVSRSNARVFPVPIPIDRNVNRPVIAASRLSQTRLASPTVALKNSNTGLGESTPSPAKGEGNTPQRKAPAETKKAPSERLRYIRLMFIIEAVTVLFLWAIWQLWHLIH